MRQPTATGRISPYTDWKVFPYFCGVCRNKAKAISELARAIVAAESGEDA